MPKKTVTLTIENVHDSWWLCQRGTYEESSVLAGQKFRQLVTHYDDLETAKRDNPGVEIVDWFAPQVFIPQTAPSWFDPLDAGEVWSEEDY